MFTGKLLRAPRARVIAGFFWKAPEVEKKTIKIAPLGSGRCGRAGGYEPAMGLTRCVRKGAGANSFNMAQSWVRSAALSTPAFARIYFPWKARCKDSRMTEAPNPFSNAVANVSEDDIRTLVHTFYGRVREDELIGPVFNAKVEDWPEHLSNLCDFWSSVVLRTRRFQGRPMRAHLLIADQISGEHFDRWLDLFEKTARDVLPPDAAPIFIQRARQIADSFEFGIATQRGEIVQPRHMKRMS
jgi:hemoglobin